MVGLFLVLEKDKASLKNYLKMNTTCTKHQVASIVEYVAAYVDSQI